jgi:hypothetical protein
MTSLGESLNLRSKNMAMDQFKWENLINKNDIWQANTMFA